MTVEPFTVRTHSLARPPPGAGPRARRREYGIVTDDVHTLETTKRPRPPKHPPPNTPPEPPPRTGLGEGVGWEAWGKWGGMGAGCQPPTVGVGARTVPIEINVSF